MTIVGGCVFTTMARDVAVMIKDGEDNVVRVTIADVCQSNGVIHIIDTVLLPAMYAAPGGRRRITPPRNDASGGVVPVTAAPLLLPCGVVNSGGTGTEAKFMTVRRFTFLLSSARAGGNTETLAYRAADGLPDSTRQDWIDLATPALPPFRDVRGQGDSIPPEGRLAEIARALRGASDVVFVAPVYWYALPAPAKLLLDHWSGWLDVPGMDFADGLRGRRLWLITCRADADPQVAALPEAMLRRTADWLGMVWGGALHGLGDAPGDVRQDTATWEAAPRFFAAAARPGS